MENDDKHLSLVSGRAKKFNVAQLLRLFLDKSRYEKIENNDENGDPVFLSPSEYMRQMVMTTEKRTDILLKIGRKFNLTDSVNEQEVHSFTAIPSIVIFQQFEPGTTYNVSLLIRNISKISQYLRMICERNPTFQIEFKGNILNTRLAPGMALAYEIKFCPEEKRDYEYEATFVSDHEIFRVPIIAIGPRAILDFPDRIEIPTTAVKISSSKTLLVRNIGHVAAIFSLYTEDPRFSIAPSQGVIDEEEIIQFTLSFLSNKIGDYESKLFLKYESGEVVRLDLQGSAVNCNIRLERGSLKMEDTYLNMSKSKPLTIHNRSDHIVKFSWMKYKDSEEDEKRREKYKQIFNVIKNMEMARCVDLVHYNICIPEAHSLICQRIYADEIISLTNEEFFYQNCQFVLEPTEGEIWPQSSIDIMVFFQPNEIGELSSVAYLEITGRENRLPLSLSGNCIGPTLKLNTVTIDIGTIYLCSCHNYEVICTNKGLIPGTLVHKPKPSDFGGLIKIYPPELKLQPEDFKLLTVSFSSNRKGDFVERIDFVIKESLEEISMYIKGSIVCPILRFDMDSLDFGMTALGFTHDQNLCLYNHSSVPVSFNLSVPDDGYEPAVTYKDFASSQTKLTFPFHPQEFIITPMEGVVSAKSSLDVKISYTPNIARSGQTSLRLDMWDSESESIFLPITYTAQIANLEIKPPEIIIGFCFINLPYTQNISIENKSNIEAYFYVLPQTPSLSTTVEYSMIVDQEYLKPGETKTIAMTVITRSLGKQETPILMLRLGESSPSAVCTLICNGQGPVVSVEPNHLDWGNLTLLENKSLELTVTNDSPIPAEFITSLGRKNSPWSVQPTAGELGSNQSIKLEVMAFLRDAGKYSDRLLIKITNSRTISASLIATGIGYCIVSKPNIFPTFDMGLLFSHQDIRLPITLINEGNRHQQLLFANIMDVRSLTKGPPQIQTYDKFQVEPNMIELPARATTTVFCKIHWNKNETVTEEWYLHVSIQGEGKRELQGSSLFKATFIEPHISFSKMVLKFRVDVDTCGEKLQQTDELYVTNQSGLDLNTHLTLDPPFHIITDTNETFNKMDIILEKNVQNRIRVWFAFDSGQKYSSRIIKAILKFEYDQHPNKDRIQCKAEVNFPSIIPIPRELCFNCELGSTSSCKLVLLNEMPIPVFYRFEWLEDSISINRLESKFVESLLEVQEEGKYTKESPGNLVQPWNSPAINIQNDGSLTKIDEAIETENQNFNDEITASVDDVKEILIEMIDWQFVDEPELKALQNINNDPPEIDFINKVLEISPQEGMLLPYTSQYTNVAFHGLEPIKIEAQILCEVELGSPEILKISAIADKLRFRVTENYIELGKQIFCEKCEASFHLESQCFIPFIFMVNTETIPKNFKVEPNCGQVAPMSNVLFQLVYQPDTVGPFEEEIEILIEHLPPFSVHLRGFAVVPQVYFCLPKNNIFKDYPMEFGYYAIQSMDDNYGKEDLLENEFNKEENCDDVSISQADYKRLTDEGWEIIDREDSIPRTIDIDMTFERLLAKKFIKENSSAFETHRSEHKKGGIPCLFTPEYVIDLGYIVVQRKVQSSATLINHGPGPVEVRLKKNEKKGDLTKSGILVEFNYIRNLLVGESSILKVTCQPKQERYKERVTDVQHVIYIEVTHGFTIPVIIKAIVTYPFLTVNTKHLDFCDVIVGECHQKRFLIKNEGYVECQWEAHLISNRKKRDEGPFYVHYTSDIFSPGHSGIIDVYFKPRKSCNIETKLLINILEGQETLSISLTGKGIEHKLKISQPSIKFIPLIPNTMADEKTIIVENPSPYPIEFYWHHLDNPFLHEDRVGRILTHYYGVKEILMPQRKMGEKMPQQLLDFYAGLVKEMAAEMVRQRAEEFKISTVEEQEVISENLRQISGNIEGKVSIDTTISDGIKKRKKSKRGKNSKGGKSRSESIISDTVKKESVSEISDIGLLPTDPQEIENLLHCYIDNLQKSPDFLEKMQDPVKEVFDTLNPKPTITDFQKNKKLFIIFHGAPFTEYQETACRSAKVIGIPALNINKAFIEIISTGNDEFSQKLRRTIDAYYDENMGKIKAHKQILISIQEEGKGSVPATSRTAKSGSKFSAKDTSRGPSMKNTIINMEALSELEKIPSGYELNIMDAYSSYETKIQSILLMENVFSVSNTISPRKDKSSARGSAKKKVDDTLLGIDYDSLKTVLKLRLSMPDFKNGFVLQTLSNDFVKNKVTMLLILLEIIEDIEFAMFVTFHNSIKAYKDRIDRLFQEKEKKAAKEIQEKLEKLEKMSDIEIEALSNEDARLYREVILSRKKEEAVLRRRQYEDKILQIKEKKSSSQKLLHPSLDKTIKSKTKLNNKKNKTATIDTANDKPVHGKLVTTKELETRPSSRSSTGKSPEKKKELEDMNSAIEQYLVDLDALLEVIRDWDPVRKEMPAKRQAKGKDKSHVVNKESSTFECFVWHARASDPWEEKMYNVVVSQISQNELISSILGTFNSLPEPDLRSKIYSLLIPKNLRSSLKTETACPCPASSNELVLKEISVTSLSFKEGSMMSMSGHQLRQSISQNKEKWKMTTNTIGLVQSVISSGSDSIESNLSLAPTIVEEPLKPTWVLQPNECQTYKVRFFPDKVGHYREDFSLSIVNSIDKTYNISVEGVSDIPRINMNACALFSKVEETKTDDTNDPTYFLDINTFDFGSLLINRKDRSKPHCRNAQFKFTNISLIPAQVKLFLKGDNPHAFSIQSEELIYIKPEETCSIELSAAATKLGTNSAKLILCISENPEVHVIELRCNGTKVDVELENKNVNFDRVLLYRELNQKVTIHNKSTISIFWVLKAIEQLNSQIAFSPNRGSMKPKESGTIDILLHASQVGSLNMNTLYFEVFLRQSDQEALLTEVITVNGEVYDVSVDVIYANPIDLKSVKVDSETSEKFSIKNRGLYEIKYAVRLESDDVLSKINSNLRKNKSGYFDIRPAADTILPDKTAIVNVQFKPRKEIVLKNAPILKCYVFDTFRKNSVIAEIPLTVSVSAYYTRFRLDPFPELNFGTVGIYKRKTMYLNVENTGKLPLQFTVSTSERKLPLFSDKGKKKDLDLISKRDKKSPSFEKPNPAQESSLKSGSFAVMKIEGEIEAGQTEPLQIICCPEREGDQLAEITVFVADCIPEDKNGKTLKLFANCCTPHIDFDDLDAIFHENNVVDSLQDFRCPKELGAHTVFARREKCLYFCRIPVLSTHSTCFKLCNRSEVQADVTISMRPEMLTSQNSKIDAFTVDPTIDCIPPMSNRIFTISFTPNLIETYSAVLEAEIELPSHLKTDRLSVRLLGEACVPEVILIEPSARTKRDHIILSFNRILVGETGVRKLAFQNVGFLEAKIIVEIFNDQNFLFSLEPYKDSAKLVHMFDSDEESNDRYIVCTLTPDEIANFRVKFQPNEVGKYESSIRIAVVGNPYENITLTLDGESFNESVVLDGLEFADSNPANLSKMNISDTIRKNRKTSLKNSSARSLQLMRMPSSSFATLIYKLDYGSCFLNRMSKISFKIINKTEDRCIRFEWSQHPNVVFTPSVGHLSPCRCKEIIATFLAAEPITHFQTLLDCTIQEILYPDVEKQMSWDDRQTNINWYERKSFFFNSETFGEVVNKKVIEPMTEPIFEVVSGSIRYIQLLLSAIVAYSEYECNVQHICFKDTLMFQSTDFKFLLTNPASVDLEYNWKLTMDDQYPIRLGESALRSSFKQRIKPKSQSRPSSRSSKGILFPNLEAIDTKNDFHHTRKFGNSHSEEELHECSDLFSSTACLTDRSTDSWIEGDNWPFEIEPENGIIPPGQSLEFNLKFAPSDVFDYKACLKCIMENLNPKQTPLCIPIKARSLLPYCHFDIVESDYLISGRRNRKLPGPIGYDIEDPSVSKNVRVIEFNVIGVGECHTKNFNLINPTMDDYNFAWNDRTIHQIEEVPNFHCITSEGIVEKGKRANVSFTFHAEDVGTFESFWLFTIDKHVLETLFLIVAHVIEPEVFCLPVHLQMKATALGWKVSDKITIINKEDFELPFKLLPECLYSEGRFHNLVIKPMSGILLPNSEQTLSVEYKPKVDGEVTFSVQCQVAKMKNPITTFVTTKAYSIEPQVCYINSQDDLIEIYHDRDNYIDFGKLNLNKVSTIEFAISNVGKVTFFYSWDLGPQNLQTDAYNITVSEREGHVNSESQITCYLHLTPLEKIRIKDHLIKLEINKGPLYFIYLKASARKPSVEFSFSEFDFGPRYVQETIAAPYHVDLKISSFEKTSSIIECTFEDLPHLLVDLENISQAIDGNSTATIRIHFRPIEFVQYQETLTFLINTATEKNVVIRGEGIPYKVRLANPCEKNTDIGNIPVGKVSTRKIKILNEGRLPVKLKFGLIKILEAFKEPKKIEYSNQDLQKEKRDKIQEIMVLSQSLSIQPEDPVVLQPNDKLNLVLKFKPKIRIKQFLEKIGAQMDYTILPLTIVRGSGVGAEFQLNRTYISFGSIVEGCTLDSNIMLLNTGDVGARFKWSTLKLGSHFVIKPVSGYCSPGMDVSFVVSFQPIHQTNFIEGEATIEIEKYGNMTITVCGSCGKLPDPLEILNFTIQVRQKQTKQVSITNGTSETWVLKPEANGDYFLTEEILKIPPKNTKNCSVSYSPLVMNIGKTSHKGQLLVKLPGGMRPILYSLLGTSLPPEAVAKLVRQFPAKTKYTESLSVYNWINRPQKFDCKIELLSLKTPSSKSENSMYTFTGNTKLDVPANGRRDYRAVFHCYKESTFNFTVTFTNPEGEYQYYELQYKVMKPEVSEVIKLTTNVRSTMYHFIQLENPLDNASIQCNITCPHQDITIHDNPKTVPPLSSERVKVEYSPLLPSEEITRLEVYCTELGLSFYELRLTAKPAPPEEVIRVIATLGGFITFPITVRNLSKKSTEFTVELEDPSFTCAKSISVQAQDSGILEVKYEPCDIENVTATLIISSNTAGQFIFPIIGSYVRPKPHGPFPVSITQPCSIQFKNVFLETKTFEFLLDAPSCFSINTLSETIESKQIANIIVNLDAEIEEEDLFVGNQFPLTGKLIVSSTDPTLSKISWIYYLKSLSEY